MANSNCGENAINKNILFVGGLYNHTNFKKYIFNVFANKGYYNVDIKDCIEIKKEENKEIIQKADIIITYSYGIQSIADIDEIKSKKVILLSPLLDNSKVKEWQIAIANKIGKTGIGINTILQQMGANKQTVKKYAADVKEWCKKYGNKKIKIKKIQVKDNWLIFDNLKQISEIPKLDGYITNDDGKIVMKHILNFDNNLLFLDKYL